MDGVQVGLLGADRSDGADTVLVSAAEGKNSVIALQSVLQERRRLEKERGLSRAI